MPPPPRRETWTTLLAASALVLAASAGACASLDGLSGGGGSDASSDGRAEAGRSRDSGSRSDAGRDATTPHDGAGRVGASDAGRDAAHLDAPGDSAARDATADGRVDSPVDGGPACTGVVVVPDAGPMQACPTVEAGACAPQPIPGYTPTWVPPEPPSVACTTQAVDALIDACFGPNQSGAACTAILQSSSASVQACNSCMITQSTASAWGPLVLHVTAGYYSLNTGGCLALLAPCQSACALAYETSMTCFLAACESTCPATGGGFAGCAVAASSCECAAESQATVACANALEIGPQGICFSATNDFAAGARAFGRLFCSGGLSAGADGGSITDAGDSG